MSINLQKAKEKWESVKKSSHFHNFLLFLLFIVIAALFWIITTMNERVQMNVDVKFSIINKPDSISFINLPPENIHITITDKGTTLFRTAMMRTPVLELNFREFASNGLFRMTNADLYSMLRTKFGSNAQISSTSIDSLRISYTDIPAKIVPIDIMSELHPATGFVVSPTFKTSDKLVKVYSMKQEILDTINKVNTYLISKSNISQNTTVETKLIEPKGVRIEPSSISVEIMVEPLVSKTVSLEIKPINVPNQESVLLFPSMAKVVVFVPMSKYNEELENATLIVNYNNIKVGRRKLPVSIASLPTYCINPSVKPDSVEYTVVR